MEDEFLRSKNKAFIRRVRFNEVKTSPLQEGKFFAAKLSAQRRHKAQRGIECRR